MFQRSASASSSLGNRQHVPIHQQTFWGMLEADKKTLKQHRLHFFLITINFIHSLHSIIVKSSCVSSKVSGKPRKLWIHWWIFINGSHRLATNVSSCYSCHETEAASADINVRIVRWLIHIGRRSKRLSVSTLQRFANLIFITVNAQHKSEKGPKRISVTVATIIIFKWL